MTAPDPVGKKMLAEDVEVPMGKSKNADIGHTSLLYNEYIVYDTAQIQIKYMIQTKFHFKW